VGPVEYLGMGVSYERSLYNWHCWGEGGCKTVEFSWGFMQIGVGLHGRYQ